MAKLGRPRKIHPFASNEQISQQIPKQVSEIDFLREENLKLKSELHDLEQELLRVYRRITY